MVIMCRLTHVRLYATASHATGRPARSAAHADDFGSRLVSKAEKVGQPKPYLNNGCLYPPTGW